MDTLREAAAFAGGLDRLGYRRLRYEERHHSPAIRVRSCGLVNALRRPSSGGGEGAA